MNTNVTEDSIWNPRWCKSR